MLGVDAEIAHPVGLDVQGGLPAVGGEVEVVDRHVLAGPGVVVPAVALGEAVDVAGHQLFGSLEHQVFEVVRQAGLGQFLVRRADAVADHRGDHRRTGDRLEEHPQSVRQRFLPDPLVKRLGGLENALLVGPDTPDKHETGGQHEPNGHGRSFPHERGPASPGEAGGISYSVAGTPREGHGK